MAFLIKSTEEKKINLPISGQGSDTRVIFRFPAGLSQQLVAINLIDSVYAVVNLNSSGLIMMISIDVYRNESEYKSGLNPLLSDINNGEFHVIIKDGDLIDLQTANLYAIERYENFGYKCELIP